MVEDATICDSFTAHMPGKKTSEDLDDCLGPIQLKEITDTDRSLFRNNDEPGLNEIEGEDFYSSVTNGMMNEARLNATDVLSPYPVSSGSKNSLGEEPSQNYNDDSANSCGHLQALNVDKECDHSTLKDICVDEGVSSQNKNDLRSENSYKVSDPTQAKVSEPLSEISSKRLPYQADVNSSFDFESLLDEVEVRSNRTQGISDGIVDKSYLNELEASANNPFLEDVHVGTCREGEREVLNFAHPSNPFDDQLTTDETEDSCIGPEETSGNISLRSSLAEGVVSAKNPFLDSSSFNTASDDSKEATKVSFEDAVQREPAPLGKEKKTTSDDKAEAPSVTSTVDSSTPGSGYKMKVPEQSDNPANAAQLQLDPFESSFATMNQYPTLISYSGQIAFSGSMSHRSESSVTSNRSFAFPVLQTEYNASPVRMAKANRKHNSWRHSLLCCNF